MHLPRRSPPDRIAGNSSSRGDVPTGSRACQVGEGVVDVENGATWRPYKLVHKVRFLSRKSACPNLRFQPVFLLKGARTKITPSLLEHSSERADSACATMACSLGS